jgi:uncharacterized protein
MNPTLLPLPRLVGMVHLRPLPGSPGWISDPDAAMASVLVRSRADARALVDGGMDGLLVENFGDLPFEPGRVPPDTAAAMALAVHAVVAEAGRGISVGVNVLRNDAATALAVAQVCDAHFIRVNVHTGTMFTDQGMLQGEAHHTLRRRSVGRAAVRICADVHVKHAAPLPGVEIEEAAIDARERGLADALIVSGPGTGRAVDPERVARVRAAVPDAPLWIGSGVTPETVADLLRAADAVIVGSALNHGGRAGAGIDPRRVEALVAAAG